MICVKCQRKTATEKAKGINSILLCRQCANDDLLPREFNELFGSLKKPKKRLKNGWDDEFINALKKMSKE